MFIKVTQSGNRRYAQLVESFRNEQGKPRQRTGCTLGRLEAGGGVDALIASLRRARGLAPAASATVETSGLCPNSGAPWDLTAWQPPGGSPKQKSMS